MLSTKDIAWVAGLLEGEGCFMWNPFVHRQHGKEYKYNRATIQLFMTDSDVVDRAASILGVKAFPAAWDKRSNRKPGKRFQVYGKRAIGWMQTLYPLLGARRQSRIREILVKYKSEGPNNA